MGATLWATGTAAFRLITIASLVAGGVRFMSRPPVIRSWPGRYMIELPQMRMRSLAMRGPIGATLAVLFPVGSTQYNLVVGPE